jgi:hypothetical protein
LRILNFLIVVAFAISGCEQRGDSKTTTEPRVPPGPSPDAPVEPGVFTKGVTYTTPCLAEQFQIAGLKVPSNKKYYLEQDGRFNRTELFYVTEKDCGNEIFVVNENGFVTDTGFGERDATYEKTSVILRNDLAVAAFNQAQVCGFSDWELDIEKDISAGTEPCFAQARPRTEHQAMLVEGTNLYFGETKNKINKSVPYTR